MVYMHCVEFYFIDTERFSSYLTYSSGQPKPANFIVAEQLMEVVLFLRIIFSFEKGVNCTFFSIFSQLFRGPPNF